MVGAGIIRDPQGGRPLMAAQEKKGINEKVKGKAEFLAFLIIAFYLLFLSLRFDPIYVIIIIINAVRRYYAYHSSCFRSGNLPVRDHQSSA